MCAANSEESEDKGQGKIITGDIEFRQEIIGLVNCGELWDVREIEPLCTWQQEALIEMERKVTVWVQQNLLKLHKMFGVDFRDWKKKHLNS